jgi:hypothetical protein
MKKKILKLMEYINKLKKLVNSIFSGKKTLLYGINNFFIIDTPVHCEKILSKTKRPGRVKYFINKLFISFEKISSK